MFLTDATRKYLSLIQFRVRKAMAQSRTSIAFAYQDESFFSAYHAISQVWTKRKSQRDVARSLNISRKTLKQWDQDFVKYGALGLLPELSYVPVEPGLEKLVVLIKSSRPHERANFTLRLAEALEIPGASLEVIRQIQRCYGYGQRMDDKDIEYWGGFSILLTLWQDKGKRSLGSMMIEIESIHFLILIRIIFSKGLNCSRDCPSFKRSVKFGLC